MKRFLLVASAASCSIGAYAQSSVALYGRIDVSTNYIIYDSTATRGSTRVKSLSSDASMFGFRGTEDLGGGKRAYFKLESGFNVDTGAQSNAVSFFNRESYVGLGDARLGSIQLGSQYTPNVFTSGRIDPFNRFGLGANTTFFQGTRGYPVSYNNAIQYLSPLVGGFSGKLLVAAGEGAPTGKGYSAEVEYGSGPLFAAVTYDQYRATAASVGLVGAPVWSKNLAAGAVYDFKVVKLHGWYQKNRVENRPDVNGYLLGLTVPAGQGDFRASYLRRDAQNADASLAAVGYYYYMSKRTFLYTQVGRLTNSGTAAFGLGPARAEAATLGLPAAGQDSKGLQLGVRHVW
jgi:predicted porin